MRVEKVSLDTAVSVFVGSRAPSYKAFGIEIELEGCPLLVEEGSVWDTWMVKRETSLRNHGAEFITNGPMHYEEVREVTKAFPKALAKMTKAKPDMSIRCSTHVHVNVAYLTLRQVFTASCLYFLFENAFVRTQSMHRQGNLFCLRMSDASYLVSMLLQSIQHPNDFNRVFSQNAAKYSALNLATVHRLGTLEWRFLSPIIDPDRLEFWVTILQGIVDYGAKHTAADLIRDYDELSLKEFMSKVWSNRAAELYDMLLSGISPGILNRAIHRNYDNIVEVSRALTRKKFEVPRAYWNPDDENAPVGLQYYHEPTDLTLDDLDVEEAPQGVDSW
jgi:hypothetical protein